MAENTGRSGQPVQKAGGRGGRSAKRGGGFRFVRDQGARFVRDGIGIEALRLGLLEECRQAFEQHVGGVFAGLRQRAFAEHAGLQVGAAQFDVDRLLDVIGIAFLDDEDAALAGAEAADLLRHQRIDHVEYEHRHARGAVDVGEPHALERAQHRIGQAAHDDDADIGKIAGDRLIELMLDDEIARRRQALLDLQPLLR